MKRTIQILLASAIAVIAMSAVASAASAATTPTVKTPGHTNATVQGSQIGNHTFTFGSLRELICTTATFDGTLSGESSTTLEVSPTYETCTTKPILGISFNATVHMNGCTYLFHGVEGSEASPFAATVDLRCPAGQSVVLNIEGAANCTVTVPAFTGHTGVTNENRGTSPQTIKNIANVSETANGSGGIRMTAVPSSGPSSP